MKDDDGWIEWRGGLCPVPEGTPVDYRLRNGLLGLGAAPADVEWRHTGAVYDIVRYRISKPAEPPKPDTSAEENRMWHGYAGKAMQGLVEDAPSELCWARYAKDAADMADAMLAEAKKRGRV